MRAIHMITRSNKLTASICAFNRAFSAWAQNITEIKDKGALSVTVCTNDTPKHIIHARKWCGTESLECLWTLQLRYCSIHVWFLMKRHSKVQAFQNSLVLYQDSWACLSVIIIPMVFNVHFTVFALQGDDTRMTIPHRNSEFATTVCHLNTNISLLYINFTLIFFLLAITNIQWM